MPMPSASTVTEATCPGWRQRQSPSFEDLKHMVSHEKEINNGTVTKKLEN